MFCRCYVHGSIFFRFIYFQFIRDGRLSRIGLCCLYFYDGVGYVIFISCKLMFKLQEVL